MAMLRVSNCPSQDLALTNCAFVNAADAKFIPHAEIGDVVLFVKPHPDVEPGALAAARQHLAREGPRIDAVPRAAADAVGNAKRAEPIVEEEGVLAAAGRLGRVRNVVRAEHDVQRIHG